MKRKLVAIGAITLVVIGIVCLYTIVGVHTVSLTEAQIQAQVNKQVGNEFPVKGVASALIKKVSLSSATTHITNGTVVATIGVDGSLRLGKKFNLDTHVVGVPHYESGAFYFKPESVQVRSFAYEGTTPSAFLTSVADKYLSDPKKQQFVKDAAPKVEDWMTSTAENAAMHSLGRNPVYRPGDDFKGMLIKASLDSVKVDNDRVLLTFTLWRLTVSVVIGILCVIAAIAVLIVLMRNPTWGTTLEIIGSFA